jgi:membrane fusion protein, multidrug efflux system
MTRKMSWIMLALLGSAAGVSAGCAGTGNADPESQGEAGRPAVAVVVAPVVKADLLETVEVVGSLAPKFSADVKSEVSGLVREIYVTEWVPIRKGARLARLDTTETQAGIDGLEAVEAQAQVAEARAQREYERALQLKQYGLITPQNLDDAKTAVEAAKAATLATSAQVRGAEARLAKAFITAPMDGIVAMRNVNVGDRVENMGGTGPLFRIVDNRLLDLTVSVPSSQLAAVHVGQPLEFTTDTLPGRSFTGKVMFINPAIEEATRSAKVVAEVPNADGALKGGAFVKGRIVVATRTGVIQVPREALVNWNIEQQAAEVFLVRNGQAEKRPVKLGAANGAAVEIVSGLESGDQVVTRGGFALRPGDRVSIAAGEGA